MADTAMSVRSMGGAETLFGAWTLEVNVFLGVMLAVSQPKLQSNHKLAACAALL